MILLYASIIPCTQQGRVKFYNVNNFISRLRKRKIIDKRYVEHYTR